MEVLSKGPLSEMNVDSAAFDRSWKGMCKALGLIAKLSPRGGWLFMKKISKCIHWLNDFGCMLFVAFFLTPSQLSTGHNYLLLSLYLILKSHRNVINKCVLSIYTVVLENVTSHIVWSCVACWWESLSISYNFILPYWNIDFPP